MRYFPEGFLNERIESLQGIKEVILPKSGKTFFYCTVAWGERDNGVVEGRVIIPEEIKISLGEKRVDGYRLLVKTRREDETILVIQDDEPKSPYFSGKINDFFSIPYGLVINFKEDGRAIKIRRFGFQQLPQRGVVKIIKTVIFDGALPFDRGLGVVRTSLDYPLIQDLAPLIMKAYEKEQARREKFINKNDSVVRTPPREIKKGGLLSFLGYNGF